ncbi:MAG TPA: universal stress protein [Thermoanaerobaculia bacterium]|jgi:nucleotide-binding universal stress UspA family protein
MRILVATDGSRAGAAAVRFASKIAAHDPKSELIVLTVYFRPGTSGSPTGGATARESAERVLGEAARVTARSGRQRARFELVRARGGDHVPEAISRQADRMRVDLVVVGSEGRETLSEWVVGGTALRLIYIARRPVTVVRAPRRRLPS